MWLFRLPVSCDDSNIPGTWLLDVFWQMGIFCVGWNSDVAVVLFLNQLLVCCLSALPVGCWGWLRFWRFFHIFHKSNTVSFGFKSCPPAPCAPYSSIIDIRSSSNSSSSFTWITFTHIETSERPMMMKPKMRNMSSERVGVMSPDNWFFNADHFLTYHIQWSSNCKRKNRTTWSSPNSLRNAERCQHTRTSNQTPHRLQVTLAFPTHVWFCPSTFHHSSSSSWFPSDIVCCSKCIPAQIDKTGPTCARSKHIPWVVYSVFYHQHQWNAYYSVNHRCQLA